MNVMKNLICNSTLVAYKLSLNHGIVGGKGNDIRNAKRIINDGRS